MLKKWLVLCSVLGLSSVAQAAGSNTVKPELAPVDVQGVWTVDYCWTDLGCDSDILTVDEFATFMTFFTMADNSEQYIDEGVGITSANYAVFHFHQGCRPNYISTEPTGPTMSGTIVCTDGSTDTGTWTAALLTRAAAPTKGFKAPVHAAGTPTMSGTLR